MCASIVFLETKVREEEMRWEEREAMLCLSLCRWNVRVTKGLCASEAVGPLQSRGPGVLHRLNALGGHSSLSLRMKERILDQRWHVWELRSEWGGRCRHVFVQPLLSWVTPAEEGRFYSGFFGTCTHKQTHSKELDWYFSVGKSCVFKQITPWMGGHRLAPFTVDEIIFVFVSVKWAVLF